MTHKRMDFFKIICFLPKAGQNKEVVELISQSSLQAYRIQDGGCTGRKVSYGMHNLYFFLTFLPQNVFTKHVATLHNINSSSFNLKKLVNCIENGIKLPSNQM